jgi:hypothetical protein
MSVSVCVCVCVFVLAFLCVLDDVYRSASVPTCESVRRERGKTNKERTHRTSDTATTKASARSEGITDMAEEEEEVEVTGLRVVPAA